MSRIIAALALTVALAPSAFAQQPNPREKKVRDDKVKVEADGYWIYNNLPKAFEEAKSSGKCNPIILKTSFAPIRVHLPPDGSYSVEAKTSFGRIASEFPITVSGAVSGDLVAGKIGDGGCELRLTNSNSSIEILKGP